MILIPAYNEAALISAVVTETRRLHTEPVVVMDDRSTDATAALATAAGATVRRLPLQLGARGATQTGLRFAHAQGCERVVTLDADGQHEPLGISAIVAPLLGGEADVCIAASPLVGGHLGLELGLWAQWFDGVAVVDLRVVVGAGAYPLARIGVGGGCPDQ